MVRSLIVSARADDLTIISWISPVSEQIKLDNRSENGFSHLNVEPGPNIIVRPFQDALTAHLVLKLKEIGIRGTVPTFKRSYRVLIQIRISISLV